MSFNNFTVKSVQAQFNLEIVEQTGLFAGLPDRPVPPRLQEILDENVPLATAINTEKARSELIIAPIMVELRRMFDRRISLFSGVELNVDRDRGLTGFCDFIISHSPEQLFVKAPLVMITEAKNENIMGGLGQCMAELVALQIFNRQEGSEFAQGYGAVTSGNLWKFLKLKDSTLWLDLGDYGIKEPGKILGILSAMIEQQA